VASREQRLISEHEKTISENAVAIAKNIADKRQAEWDLLEVQDKFDQRDQAKADQAAELERKQRRHARMKEWIKYAVDTMPDGARGKFEPAVIKAVRAELALMNVDDDDEVVQRVIDATVKSILKDWYWEQDALKALKSGQDSLPWQLKSGTSVPNEWEEKALTAGAVAIDEAIAGAGGVQLPYREMERIAIAAVKRMVDNHNAEQAAEKAAQNDREMRERVKRDARIYWLPWGLNDELHTIFVEAIENFVNRSPGLSEPDLKAALKKEVTALSETLDRARRQAADNAKANTDPVPQAKPRPQLELPRNSVVKSTEQPSVRVQERRTAAERRLDPLLDACIARAVAKEERDGLELDGPADRMKFVREIKDAIRPGLVRRWSTITNLNAVSDETLGREISQAARAYIMEVVPEER
jgi:hypothetical protein